MTLAAPLGWGYWLLVSKAYRLEERRLNNAVDAAHQSE
jgi:hypothetical protein